MGFNSTIRVKEKVCINCGKPCIWFSRKRCQQCAKVEDFYAKEEKIVKEDGFADLIEDLDALVSKWVRFGAIDEYGLVQCYTCSTRLPPAQMDAGHYISRKCFFLRFDASRNIRPQCGTCNRAKSGKAAQFGKNLELEHPGITEILLEESYIITRWSRDELNAMITDFKQRVKQLNK